MPPDGDLGIQVLPSVLLSSPRALETSASIQRKAKRESRETPIYLKASD